VFRSNFLLFWLNQGNLTVILAILVYFSNRAHDVKLSERFNMSGSDGAYELFLEDRPHYLYALVKADAISPEIAMAYIEQITERLEGVGYERLLLHRDIPDMLPDGQLFMVATDFQEKLRGIKTAYVNKFTVNDEAFDFAVRVGTNRGAEYAIFNNDEAAHDWLVDGLDDTE